MNYDLICEGRCNPAIFEIDEMVKQFQKKSSKSDFPLYDRMVAAQRRLTHTPHTMNGSGRATCCDCGKARKFGD